MWRFYLYFVKITTPKSIISTGWETINHLVRAPDTWHVWPMDNDGSLIVCQLLFTFQISFNSSPSRPHPWREPVICAARTGWGKECLELMIPIIRQKPLFIHHFGSCDPAWPTQASVNTRERWNLHDLTFLLTQSDEWWRDIQILFVTRGEGWVCQDCDRSLITGDKLCLHWGVITGVIMQTCGDHSRSSHPQQIFMNADTSARMMKRWSSLQPDQILSRVSSSYYASPSISSSILRFCLVQMLRNNQTRGVGTRSEKRWGVGPPRRDAESNDPEVRLVRT